ncbi:MAG: DUF1015 domain-containing protein, partial [Lewinella sp.]|nr:DUF1015 domain-containing protein [Lewinella sp.]
TAAPKALLEAREEYFKLLETGFYAPIGPSALYLLRIRAPYKAERYALGGLLETAEYAGEEGLIRPHEGTRKSLEVTQRALFLDRGAIIKPILLTCPAAPEFYRALSEAAATIGQPALLYQEEQQTYELFLLTENEQLLLFSNLLAVVPRPIAVADGHHRILTAQHLAQDGYPAFARIPAFLMSADSLSIEAYVRSIKCAEQQQPEQVWVALKQFFYIEPQPRATAPTGPGQWLLFHQGQAYQLKGKPEPGQFDAVWFNDRVLPEVFGIHDSSRDPRIHSVDAGEALSGIRKKAQQQPASFHFQGFPLTMDEFFSCVRAKKLLPPKSTRFFPRIPSGMMVYPCVGLTVEEKTQG